MEKRGWWSWYRKGCGCLLCESPVVGGHQQGLLSSEWLGRSLREGFWDRVLLWGFSVEVRLISVFKERWFVGAPRRTL